MTAQTTAKASRTKTGTKGLVGSDDGRTLDKKGVMVGQEKKYDLDELDICVPDAIVLHDGNL
jgi:hypothetical protein